MRGKDLACLPAGKTAGITPAHAGKSLERIQKAYLCGDHPRACGEKSFRGLLMGGIAGSPPRMRGKVASSIPAFAQSGITPAHAGKRRPRHGAAARGRDHPRACGEKMSVMMTSSPKSGSPPRMRGKDLNDSLSMTSNGITPAHAGKRAGDGADGACSWDHPRACGEKTQEVTKYKAYDILHA